MGASQNVGLLFLGVASVTSMATAEQEPLRLEGLLSLQEPLRLEGLHYSKRLLGLQEPLRLGTRARASLARTF